MKASDLFVQCLENEGTETIFGVPGEENIDLLDSLSRSSIKLVLTRHEQTAGFMAATHGRLTGKAGVCLATLGPGATNLVTAAAYAQLGAMPMLMITGQKPIRTSKQGRFQIIDVVDMMTPITKSTTQLVSAEAIPSQIRNAFRLAEEERPGATHIELPEDVAREEAEVSPIDQTYSRRPIAEGKAVSHAVSLLKECRHPLLLIGAGANRTTTASMLKRFVEEQKIPFVTTQMGKGVVDERHPLFLGNAAMSDKDFPHRALDHADLILNVGHDVVEKPPFFMRTGDRKVIHVNFTNPEIDPVYFPHAAVVGDIANSIWQINQALTPQAHWDFRFFHQVAESLAEHSSSCANDDRFPMLPQYLVGLMRRVMPEDGIVALDNGIYKLWFARNYPAARSNTLLIDNALASMGAGLPSAMAAKMVHPDRKVVAVVGDGGFMMNSQDLETAVRLNLSLVVVILNDSAYGMIRWKQADMGFPDYGLSFKNPDFVLYAQCYGAKGHRISASKQLAPLLQDCLEQGGIHLIDLPVDYSLNGQALFEDIPAASAALVNKHQP